MLDRVPRREGCPSLEGLTRLAVVLLRDIGDRDGDGEVRGITFDWVGVGEEGSAFIFACRRFEG